MAGDAHVQPVAADEGGIGVIGAKEGVGQGHYPGIPLIGLPALHHLGAGDNGGPGLGGAVDNGLVLVTGPAGADLFPVDAGSHQHLVAGLGHGCCLADGAEGAVFATIAGVGGSAVHITDHSFFLLSVFFFIITGHMEMSSGKIETRNKANEQQ